jgi:hypothetical protein
MNKIVTHAAGLFTTLSALFFATIYLSEYGGAAALPILALQFISCVLAVRLAIEAFQVLSGNISPSTETEHHFG